MNSSNTAQAQSKAQSNSNSQSGWKRYLWIAIVLVAAIAVALFLYWPRIELGFTINALNSGSAETFRDSRAHLVRAPREAWVDDALRDALEDESRSFKLRSTLVGVFLDRNQHALLERIYLEGGTNARGPILTRLQGQPFFMTTYVNDDRFAVRETLRQWVRGSEDRTRWNAIPLVQRLDLRELIPELRAMLDGGDDKAADPRKLRAQRMGSMRALATFGDCDSVATIAELVRVESDGRVRAAALDALEILVLREGAPCGGLLPQEELVTLAGGMLESDQREVAIKALMHLEKNPAIGKELAARLGEMVKPGAGDADGILRRHALLALIAQRDPAFLDTMPIYFHDENTFVRSSAAEHTGPLTMGPRLESCLIGLLDRETGYMQAWRSALMSLRLKASQYIGFPEPIRKQARNSRQAFVNVTLAKLYEGQTVHGVDRASLVAAWFAWFAKDLGLDGDRAEAAAAARTAFWEAIDGGKRDEAVAALAAFGDAPAGLFTFEESFLAGS